MELLERSTDSLQEMSGFQLPDGVSTDPLFCLEFGKIASEISIISIYFFLTQAHIERSFSVHPVSHQHGEQSTCVVVIWASRLSSLITSIQLLNLKLTLVGSDWDAFHACVENKGCKIWHKFWKGIDERTYVNIAQNGANSCLLARITDNVRMLYKRRISVDLAFSCGRAKTIRFECAVCGHLFLETRNLPFSKITGYKLLWFEFRAVKRVCLLDDAVLTYYLFRTRESSRENI